MGLLLDDNILNWEETKKHTNYIKSHAIRQFLHVWDTEKDRQDDPPLWGDEIEYFLVYFDEKERNAKASLRQKEVKESLAKVCPEDDPNAPEYSQEFTRFMIESNPSCPYNSSFRSLLTVEADMQRRRNLIWGQLNEHEAVVTLSNFPRYGAKNFTHPPVDYDVISEHARYEVLTAHIRERKGSKPTANIPIFFDKHTSRPFIDHSIPKGHNEFPEDNEVRTGAAYPNHIYLDTVILGYGGCCLQVNIQLKNMNEARRVFDVLLPITPIMLALTASSPVFKGYLSDVDCRTYAASRLLDDRHPEEHNNIRKSRGDIGDMYIWMDPRNKKEYNDVPLNRNENAYSNLKAHGIDEQLSQFLAVLFVRDPLLAYENHLEPEGPGDMLHFENINSSVWQTMRLKPPVPNSSLGWRVEFRSMEASITNFESAAYSIFLVLLTRAILHLDLNFYIPISKVEENMRIAERRDAARRGYFHFRKNIFSYTSESQSGSIADEYESMTIDEIFNGKKNESRYPGLIKLVRDYIIQSPEDESTKYRLLRYVDFISKKAEGTLPTTATWIREYIHSHPSYKFDSVVSEEINFDLLKTITRFERGEIHIPELLPESYYLKEA